MTDHELHTLIKKDLSSGTAALYQQYIRYVYAIVFRLLRDCGTKEDVEDCVADTFADVFARLDSLEGADLKAYIGRAAHNKALNYCRVLSRNRQHTMPLEDVPEVCGGDLSSHAEERHLKQVLLDKIQLLGEPDASILIMKYYFGRKMSEIAGALGMSTHTAQVRCGRALKRLRKELEDWR
ncbi:MAG: sigma-70 family RNA polymerase sigma factor [Oscillospiraceae bacterium]|nr:sigma-70 family RNA polymerase sigma factor [Oscillospiraceae bacterium]